MAGIRLQTSCTLCDDEFSDARRLSCDHAFCTKCLVTYIKRNTRSGKFKCNDCDKLHDAPKPVNTNSVHLTFPDSEQRVLRSMCRTESHGNREAILYCTDHQMPICSKCVLKTHTKCSHADLAEISSASQKAMGKLAITIDTYIRDLRKITQLSDKYFEKLKTHAADIESQIKETVQLAKAKLDAEGRNLLKKVDEIVQNADEKRVKSAQRRQEAAAVELYTAAKDASQSADISKPELEKEWQQVAGKQVSSFTYKHFTDTRKMGVLVGEVQGLTQTRVIEADKQQGGDRKMGVFTLQGTAGVGGITEVYGHILVGRCGQSNIEVYNADLKRVANIDVPTLQSAYPGLISTKHGSDISLIVGDGDGKAIHFMFVKTEWKIHECHRKQLQYRPETITFDKQNGQLVVLDDTNKRICMYSTRGEELTALQLVKRVFSEPRCAVKLGPMFLVADPDKEKVAWLDGSGRVQTEYNGTDQQPLKYPCHLVVDTESAHVLVVDSHTHCVEVVDEEGNYTTTVVDKTDGITFPRRAHLADDGRLYVAYGAYDKEQKIAVLEYRQSTHTSLVTVLETSLTTTLILNT